jgi:hypothetical protein
MQSVSAPNRAEPVTVVRCLIGDSPYLEGQFPYLYPAGTRISLVTLIFVDTWCLKTVAYLVATEELLTDNLICCTFKTLDYYNSPQITTTHASILNLLQPPLVVASLQASNKGYFLHPSGSRTAPGLEIREYCSGDLLRWPRDKLYPQKLALTPPTTGGSSLGIVRSQTKATVAFSVTFLFLYNE